MDIIGTLGSDAGLLLFSAAGLVATSVAILFDTRSQRMDSVRIRLES